MPSLWSACRSTVKRAALRALGVVHTVNTAGGNAVLLTFDDGPHPDVTPGVLQRLRAHRARAVFFVVGSRIPRAPHLLREILAEGHLIGNHTFEHWLGRGPWPRQYLKDVARCQEVVGGLTGQAPTLFRPPLGSLTVGSLTAARALGLKCVHWSVDSGDWRLRDHDSARALGGELAGRVGPDDVVLLHDDNPCVLTVLDVLLPTLTARGLDLLGAVHQLSASQLPERDPEVAP